MTTLVLALIGCGSNCPDPFYDGAASDEAWRTMQDAEVRAVANDAKAVHLFFPTEGEKLNGAGAAPTFKWTSPLIASRLTPPGPRQQSMLSRVSGWIYSTAWAHLPPVTGPVLWAPINSFA